MGAREERPGSSGGASTAPGPRSAPHSPRRTRRTRRSLRMHRSSRHSSCRGCIRSFRTLRGHEVGGNRMTLRHPPRAGPRPALPAVARRGKAPVNDDLRPGVGKERVPGLGSVRRPGWSDSADSGGQGDGGPQCTHLTLHSRHKMPGPHPTGACLAGCACHARPSCSATLRAERDEPPQRRVD